MWRNCWGSFRIFSENRFVSLPPRTTTHSGVFFITTDEIDRVLRGRQDYRLEVYAFFSTHSDPKEREQYLKSYHGGIQRL